MVGTKGSAVVARNFNGWPLPIDIQGKLGVHPASKFKAGPSDRRYAHGSLDRIVPERLQQFADFPFSGLPPRSPPAGLGPWRSRQDPARGQLAQPTEAPQIVLLGTSTGGSTFCS
jgi:hypothetical protein